LKYPFFCFALLALRALFGPACGRQVRRYWLLLALRALFGYAVIGCYFSFCRPLSVVRRL